MMLSEAMLLGSKDVVTFQMPTYMRMDYMLKKFTACRCQGYRSII